MSNEAFFKVIQRVTDMVIFLLHCSTADTTFFKSFWWLTMTYHHNANHYRYCLLYRNINGWSQFCLEFFYFQLIDHFIHEQLSAEQLFGSRSSPPCKMKKIELIFSFLIRITSKDCFIDAKNSKKKIDREITVMGEKTQ